jgi:hypothetical protein
MEGSGFQSNATFRAQMCATDCGNPRCFGYINEKSALYPTLDGWLRLPPPKKKIRWWPSNGSS